MDNKKNRLSSIQKILLDNIHKKKILDNLQLPDVISAESIDINDLKNYNDIHNNINNILVEYKIEPHEILNLINNYEGNHTIFNKFKNFIISRNICILKKIYKSEKWNSNVKKIIDVFSSIYKCPKKININDLFNQIIMDILIKDVKMFDITQCKIELDSKNNIKLININSLDDQKYIIAELLKNGGIKI